MYDLAPESRDELTLLLAMMDWTSGEIRDLLKDASDDDLQWKDPNVGRSIGMILLHLADAEYWWIQSVALGKSTDQAMHDRFLSSELDQMGGKWPDAPIESKAWYLAGPDEIRKLTKESLQGVDPATTIGKRGEREFSLRWIMHHLIEHEAYHMGQIQMLLEMQDA